MTLLASVMLLASACTGKQASEKTASGLEPANFRTEVDGKQTDLFVLKNKNGQSAGNPQHHNQQPQEKK